MVNDTSGTFDDQTFLGPQADSFKKGGLYVLELAVPALVLLGITLVLSLLVHVAYVRCHQRITIFKLISTVFSFIAAVLLIVGMLHSCCCAQHSND
jgi:hypothetical protein